MIIIIITILCRLSNHSKVNAMDMLPLNTLNSKLVNLNDSPKKYLNNTLHFMSILLLIKGKRKNNYIYQYTKKESCSIFRKSRLITNIKYNSVIALIKQMQ